MNKHSRRIARRTNSTDDWEQWKKEKNRINNLLRNETAKNELKEQKIVEDDMTGRQIWNRVKRLAGWSTSLSPTIFTTDSGIISNPKLMADHINNFFCSKISKICDQLKLRVPSDPLALLRANMNKWKDRNKVDVFELTEVTPKRVRELFRMINNSDSEDLNGLSNRIIKTSLEALVHPITPSLISASAPNPGQISGS